MATILSEFVGLVFVSGILMVLCMAQASLHYYDFVLKETNFTRLCSTKSMLTVNDSFPGPVIRAYKGDTVYVNVHNQGDYGVTIHWHGVKQPRNPWSDGPQYITQCPIEPRSNFTYEVILSIEEGTLWWHAHSNWTRASVHGAIVVYPTIGTTYPFPKPDEEEIIVLGSWYKGDVNKMVAESLETGSVDPHSDAYTINGQPGDFCACSSETTYRRLVDYGKTYLLRIVNAVMNVELFFAIAQHNLTVLGIDGAYVKPIATTYIMISTGQTMDVLVTANQSLGHYYVAARQYDSLRPDVTDYNKANATAILVYRGNYTPPSSPSFPSDTLPSYEDVFAALNFMKRIKSLASRDYPVNVPQNITTRMYIVASGNDIIYPNNVTGLAASLNNISWADPSTDVLLAYYRNISGIYTTDFPDQPPSYFDFTAVDVPTDTEMTVKGTKVKMLNYNEEVEIVFQGPNVLDASVDHPMHLHGYSFYVVGMSHGNFDNETDPKGFNLVDPPELNTISIPKNGWVAIRFVANNPGVWFLHCHFERHISWGMNSVFIVKNGGTPETSIRDPPVYLPPYVQQYTIPQEVEKMASSMMKDIVVVSIGKQNRPNGAVKQLAIWVESKHKKQKHFDILMYKQHFMPPVVVFVGSRFGADLLSEAIKVTTGMKALSIHGEKSMERRDIMKTFLVGEVPVLVATGILGRGVDLLGVRQVIVFDMPNSIKEYVHQIGRASRLGEEGRAFVFMNEDNKNVSPELVEILRSFGAAIPRELANSRYTVGSFFVTLLGKGSGAKGRKGSIGEG